MSRAPSSSPMSTRRPAPSSWSTQTSRSCRCEAGRSEIEGGPSLSATTLERLACDCGVRLAIDERGVTLDVGRRTRSIPPALRRAIVDRDQGRCRFPGCTHTGRLQVHHGSHWSRRRTDEEAQPLPRLPLPPQGAARRWMAGDGRRRRCTDVHRSPWSPDAGDLVAATPYQCHGDSARARRRLRPHHRGHDHPQLGCRRTPRPPPRGPGALVPRPTDVQLSVAVPGSCHHRSVPERIRRSGDRLVLKLYPTEVELLRDLAGQLESVLDGGVPERGDDPVRERLFPRAYLDPTEDEAESEWQGSVHEDLVRAKSAAVGALVDSLDTGTESRRGTLELELPLAGGRAMGRRAERCAAGVGGRARGHRGRAGGRARRSACARARAVGLVELAPGLARGRAPERLRGNRRPGRFMRGMR